MASSAGDQAASFDVGHFSWFHKFGFPFEIDHVVTSSFVALVLLLLSLGVYKSYRNPKEKILPESKFSLGTVFELITLFIYNTIEGLLGDDAKKYTPLLGSVFLYIFLCNFIGLVPGFQPPTTVLSTNLAVALFVFLYYNYIGFKENGAGYIKHFLGPVWWLGPLILIIELIGHVVRPISLALRLGGNMTGDHMVLNIFADLTPYVIPVLFLGLGLFVDFIQAFVFTLLSSIYIALAATHDH